MRSTPGNNDCSHRGYPTVVRATPRKARGRVYLVGGHDHLSLPLPRRQLAGRSYRGSLASPSSTARTHPAFVRLHH